MQTSTREIFDTLAKVLLRCWIFGSALLAFWLGAAWLLGDVIHKLHGPMFGITMHEFDIIFYSASGMLKLFVLVFFFIITDVLLFWYTAIEQKSVEKKIMAERDPNASESAMLLSRAMPSSFQVRSAQKPMTRVQPKFQF